MRIVLQRVKQASVSVQAEIVGAIEQGLLLYVGFGRGDSPTLPKQAQWHKMIAKIPELRIFPDHNGKSNLSLQELGGEVLAISQFTLYADCRKGRRPSFTGAAEPEVAEALYARFLKNLEHHLPGRVHSGVFGAEMDIASTNWGPVTIILDTRTF
ncbi:MAG: D-tyrosyl-tRNA(Tyr) deacylase [Desulfohalobiaceae bacterium]|nr:D-tyrosyl-tRNA(Tyr) deacylase [Desulfohalobiaceae bacterium]